MSDSPRQVDIHLTIHKQQEDVHVNFKFDPGTDTVDSVVAELGQTLELGDAEKEQAKIRILEQIRTSLKPDESYPPASRASNDPQNSSDEEIDDPEYTELLRSQQRALDEMDERHLREQGDLVQKMTSMPDDDLLIFG